MKKQGLMGAVVLVVGLALGAQALAGVKDFARLVPEDTILYAEAVYDEAALKQMHASPGYKMVQDERVKAIMEEMYKLTDELYEKIGIPMKEMGLSLRDTENFQEGGYAIAAGMGVQPVGNTMTPSPKIVFIFDLSSKKMKKVWDKVDGVMATLVKQDKVKLSEHEVEGVKVRVYQLTPPGGAAPAAGKMIVPSFYTDGKIGVFGLNLDSLAGCLKVINARGKGSLADSKLYKDTIAKLSNKRTETVFFNTKAVVAMAAAMAPIPPKEKKIVFETLGLSHIESIGIGSWADENGAYSDLFIHSPALKCPLFKPFIHAKSDFALVKGVSKYAPAFMAMSFDAPETYDLLMGLVKEIAGEEKFKKIMEDFERGEEKLGFNVKDDLLKSLGHEVVFTMPSISLDLGSIPSVFPGIVAIEVKDQAKIEKIIGILLKKAAAKLSQKKIGDTTVFYHPVGAYCFSGKHLIIGNSPTQVERFLDTMAGKNLNIEKTDAYKKAMKALNGKKSVLAYMSLEQTIRMISGILFIVEHSDKFRMFGIRPPFDRRPPTSRREPPHRYPVPEDPERAEPAPEPEPEPEGPEGEHDGSGAEPPRAQDDMEDVEEWEPPDEDSEFGVPSGRMGMFGPPPEVKKMMTLLGRLIAIIPEYSTACYVAVVPDSDGLIIKTVIP